DGRVALVLDGFGPLVDVAGHVVDAERALAERVGPGRLALPHVVDLADRERAVANGEEALVEQLPGAVDDAALGIAHVAVRVGARLLALAGEGPLVLGAEARA